ncbi:MAG TPA: hypothetical protein VKA10_05395, partial [Prolixibacteraceae bacterium]|nr:hypothetical protein [Prolixibacteraceae bacterium]
AFSFFIPEYYLPVMPYTLLFFMVVALGVHAWQLRLARKNFAKFAQFSMLITFFKLVIYSVFGVIYIANNRENAVPFVISLMILYLVFTVIEVAELARVTRKNK